MTDEILYSKICFVVKTYFFTSLNKFVVFLYILGLDFVGWRQTLALISHSWEERGLNFEESESVFLDVGFSADAKDHVVMRWGWGCFGDRVEWSPFWGLPERVICLLNAQNGANRAAGACHKEIRQNIFLSPPLSRWRIRQASVILTQPLRRRACFWKQIPI